MAGTAEIGSHSATHPDIGRVDVGHLGRELVESREAIEKNVGTRVTSFAIPFGQSNNWSVLAQQEAAAAGYEVVYAQAEETRPAGTVPRTFVTQFDQPRIFDALLEGAFDRWEEWF
jgi:peptidoglycan/xylan/chitin deacetylase (PgdA/CDA1 family)